MEELATKVVNRAGWKEVSDQNDYISTYSYAGSTPLIDDERGIEVGRDTEYRYLFKDSPEEIKAITESRIKKLSKLWKKPHPCQRKAWDGR